MTQQLMPQISLNGSIASFHRGGNEISNTLGVTLRTTRDMILPDGVHKFDLIEEDLKFLLNEYKNWLEESLYLVTKFDNFYQFDKASKRGNSVYANRVRRQLRSVDSFFNSNKFKRLMPRQIGREFYTNVLFLTATHDTKIFLGNRHKAWSSITYYWNKFISNFRKHFSKAWVFRVIESTKNGYPHIHALVITSKPLKCFVDNKGTWRITNKKEISRHWHSKVFDLKSPKEVGRVKNYIVKDLLKQFTNYTKTPQDMLSLSLNWLYRKQSFAISGRVIMKELTDLINATGIIQNDLSLQSREITQNGGVFIGLTVIHFTNDIAEPPNRFQLSEKECDSLGLLLNLKKKSDNVALYQTKVFEQ